MKVYLKGLNGCGMRRTNVARYAEYLRGGGHELVSGPEGADAALVWSCGFRADYRDNTLAEIQRLRIMGLTVVVAGCLPAIDGARLSDPDIYVAPWGGEQAVLDLVFDGGALLAFPPMLCEAPKTDGDVSFIDRFVKLYTCEGCPLDCAYCSERLAFPPFRSFPRDRLVSECAKMVAECGCRDVLLLGDCLGAYGRDCGGTLSGLVHSLIATIADVRIGLQGVHPMHWLQQQDYLLWQLRNGNIFHLQLPIQSACDKILRAMRRRYSRREIGDLFYRLGRFRLTSLDTHLIAGFPGETADDFQESIDFILQYPPHYVLVSAFMEAPKMAATAMPHKVPDEEKRARLVLATQLFAEAGILCNGDGGRLAKDRFERMNKAPGLT